jgi:hypothetical protein
MICSEKISARTVKWKLYREVLKRYLTSSILWIFSNSCLQSHDEKIRNLLQPKPQIQCDRFSL